MAKIIELILTEGSAGNGTEDSPYRRVVMIYTKDGRQVLRCDPYLNETDIVSEALP